jgi:hypothetical protein
VVLIVCFARLMRQTADGAQREGQLRGLGQRGVAAEEQEGEGVVSRGELTVGGQLEGHRGLLAPSPGALAPPLVDQAS